MNHASPGYGYPYRHETVVFVRAAAGEVFAFVDDHARLSSHMSRRSWMMGGGSMAVETDAGRSRVVGSKLKLHGTAFGMRVSVEEIVTDRTPPLRKTWQTVGEPLLLVIGSYRMGIEIEGRGNSSCLRVWIEYALPKSGAARFLGFLFGRGYARWCTRQMANDASRHFEVVSSGDKRKPTDS